MKQAMKFEKQKLILVLISLVWFTNGFYCKILDQVPRHQEIVARILGDEYAREYTFTIGVLELVMVAWILTNYKSKLNVIIQIIIIISMNIIEFFLANDLLLFTNLNILFALFFCSIIHYNEFIFKKKNYV